LNEDETVSVDHCHEGWISDTHAEYTVADRFNLEIKAFNALRDLMQQAAECRSLFESARLPMPDPLRRILGAEDEVDATEKSERIVVPPPKMPARPPGWQSDWIWLPTPKLTAQSAVCAVLGAATGPLSPNDIIERCGALGVDVVKGSVMNIGTRLAGGKDPTIRRNDGQWSLLAAHKVPVLHDEHAWGAPSVFDKQELAAHRRQAVLHLLKLNSDGLQIVQITKALRECEWMRAPITKDLVKVDVQLLQQDGQAKRVGNSGKWKAVA
jgi:hypothetical protein